MSSSYDIFSQFYDGLTQNVNYKKRAEFFRTLLIRYGVKDGASVLDMGCGTGKFTCEMAKLGYDMIGIDNSPEMLNEARNNMYDNGVEMLLLCQSMENLDLYGTVDCAVSTLDSINHLPGEQSVKKAFYNSGLFMNPNGVLIFDINTIYKHKKVLGNNTFVYDTDDVFCVWQNALNCDDSVTISLDFFEPDGDVYYRSCEEFTEYAYAIDDIKKWLEDAEFEVIDVFDDVTDSPLKENSQRAVIAARYTGKKDCNG